MNYTTEEQKRLLALSRQLLRLEDASNTLEAASRANDLREVIRYHEWRYYILHEPVIGDTDFDLIFKQLQRLEKKFPDLKTEDSPTLRVSSDLIEDFVAVEHLAPMLSLQNSYNADDLREFDEQVKRFADLPPSVTDVEYVVEPKFDGGTIVLVYENDVLVRAATRGNGAVGDDITPNARMMRSIPLRAEFSKLGIKKVELRGEALIAKKNFEEVNALRAVANQPLFANPRNAATGCLRTKKPQDVVERRVETFAYQLGYAEDLNGVELIAKFGTHHESIEALHSLGFKVPTVETKLCKNIDEVIEFCNMWSEKRDTYDYEIDGMVVKINELAIQQRCGATTHHPRWAIAYKFQARQATTKLVAVEYQVGKIGTITPVAKVEPVQVGGVTVTSISLHNEDNIRNRDLRLGDTVIVERAGDVIPQIVKPLTDLRDGSETPIEYPKYCPINTTELVELFKEEGEAAWRCPHCTCGAQDLQRFIFHVSKNAMNIESFGEANMERFQKLGWLKTLEDIYRIDYEAVAKLEGFGVKSAQNLKKSIEKAKQNPIHRFLHSLSIHQLGREAAKLLAAEINHVLDLKNWDMDKYLAIKGIGKVLAQNVMTFFANEKNILLLQNLENLGVNLQQTEEDRKSSTKGATTEGGKLLGKTILFTGTLTTFNREKAEAAAQSEGASIASSVNKSLNILVVGEKAGSKLEKAKKLGSVQILTEAEFIAFLA